MDKTMNISFIYGTTTCLSLLFACCYCAFVRKKEIWLIWLYFSVFIANLGYFTLSISKSLEEALLANRLAYLGCVFLPLFMLMTILKVCRLKCPRIMLYTLISISFLVFLIVASQGYLDIYYKEVQLVFVNGTAMLQKVYGPLHNLYYIYLFLYFMLIIGSICIAAYSKKVASYKHAALLAVVVLFNIAIWLVEQFINWDFEFLAVSYIASELLLLFLYGMIQDYELLIAHANTAVTNNMNDCDTEIPSPEQLVLLCPEIERLSARERDVFQKILEDKKRKEIAEELFITENTVKKHISNIFAKLEVSNRNELFDKIKQKQLPPL